MRSLPAFKLSMDRCEKRSVSAVGLRRPGPRGSLLRPRPAPRGSAAAWPPRSTCQSVQLVGSVVRGGADCPSLPSGRERRTWRTLLGFRRRRACWGAWRPGRGSDAHGPFCWPREQGPDVGAGALCTGDPLRGRIINHGASDEEYNE